MNNIKSVIIYQNGKKIIHLKRKPYGIISEILQDIGQIGVTCVMENDERIKINNKSNIK